MGVNATIRREQGSDIDAACGQLRAKGTTSRNEVRDNAKRTIFTDTGQHRDKNEDAGGYILNKTHQQLLVLCDGMGGHQAGEIASQFVTNEL